MDIKSVNIVWGLLSLTKSKHTLQRVGVIMHFLLTLLSKENTLNFTK